MGYAAQCAKCGTSYLSNERVTGFCQCGGALRPINYPLPPKSPAPPPRSREEPSPTIKEGE